MASARRSHEFRPALESVENRLVMDAGLLDPTFRILGIVIDPVTPPGNRRFGKFDAITVQLDGKIVGAENATVDDDRLFQERRDGQTLEEVMVNNRASMTFPINRLDPYVEPVTGEVSVHEGHTMVLKDPGPTPTLIPGSR